MAHRGWKGIPAVTHHFTPDTIAIDFGMHDIRSASHEMVRTNSTLDEVLSRVTDKNVHLQIGGNTILVVSYYDPALAAPFSQPPERATGWHIKAVAAGRSMFPRGPKDGAPVDGQRDGFNAIGCAPTLIEAIAMAEAMMPA
jgi:hypothetical protein